MIVLATMDLEARRSVHGAVHAHHWRQEGKHHGRRGHGRRACVAGYVPVMIAEISSHWPLDPCVYEEANDREHGQRGNPLRLCEPHRAHGGGMLAPATAWCYG